MFLLCRKKHQSLSPEVHIKVRHALLELIDKDTM